MVLDEERLNQVLNYYLENPKADREACQQFVQDECTYVDGSAGHQTSENILSLLGISRAQ